MGIKSTSIKLSTIARFIERNDPERYQAAVKMCQPCITNPSIIPAIHQAIREAYPELDKTDESILFAATVYTAYSPASLFAPGIERAPNGIRQEMCKVMQWNDAPVVNYYTSIASAYVKNPKYRDKVQGILAGFVSSPQIEVI